MLYQQGDVLILEIGNIPINAKKEPGEIILAHGESGHTHIMLDTKKINLLKLANDLFINVFEKADVDS